LLFFETHTKTFLTGGRKLTRRQHSDGISTVWSTMHTNEIEVYI